MFTRRSRQLVFHSRASSNFAKDHGAKLEKNYFIPKRLLIFKVVNAMRITLSQNNVYVSRFGKVSLTFEVNLDSDWGN